MNRWLLTGALLVLLAPPAGAAEARLFVTAGAPFGVPGARTNLTIPCDGKGADTLYLSFDPGRDSPGMLGLSSSLYFHVAEGDSLGSFWKIDDMNVPNSPIRVVFEADTTRGFVTPFLSPGAGQGRYDYAAGSGRIRIIYAVAANAASPVEGGHIYGFARIIVRRPGEKQGGCGQPMCVEWHSASIALGMTDVFDANGGPRWATINSPDGMMCESFRTPYATKPWKPKTGKP